MIKKVLIIIAQLGYQDHEYSAPKEILENAGIKVITASKKQGFAEGSLGGKTKVELALSGVKVMDYDAVVFIGGPGAVAYQQDKEAQKIAQEAVLQRKILAAICIAPTILAYSGVLQEKKATVWNLDKKQSVLLESKGASYTGKDVTVDGKIITANGPVAAEKFGKEILKMLSE